MPVCNKAMFAAFALVCALSACTSAPPANPAALDSGITASNGGGMRATGGLPNAGVTNGVGTVGTMSSSPRVPTY